AILKGIADAKKNMMKVSLADGSIPHEAIGIFGAGKVLMKPAPEGTGVIAGGACRAVMEAVGIRNITARCLRSNNPQNVVKATMEGLKSLRSPEQVAAIRGKSVEEIRERRAINMANLKIELVKSLNGRLEKHIATAHSLGLRKIGQVTIQPDNTQTRGKIALIGYLLRVTEVE
ncbi:MAG: 50S ribosomal protein L30, partial [Oscillospiraceae bacterium]|nr:50S ribosomal protein L30 [Oscillospiraceae bacterium]